MTVREDPMTEPTQGRDVAEFIREQHQEITRLFSAVEAGQGDGRQDAVECLVRLQAVDETAEEEVVRPSVHPHATSRFLPAGWLHRGTRDPPLSIRFAGLLGHAPAVTRRGTVARLTRRGAPRLPGDDVRGAIF